jgi:hypothetical protein
VARAWGARRAALRGLCGSGAAGEARCESAALAKWQSAGADDWRSSERFLSKRFQHNWSDRSQLPLRDQVVDVFQIRVHTAPRRELTEAARQQAPAETVAGASAPVELTAPPDPEPPAADQCEAYSSEDPRDDLPGDPATRGRLGAYCGISSPAPAQLPAPRCSGWRATTTGSPSSEFEPEGPFHYVSTDPLCLALA